MGTHTEAVPVLRPVACGYSLGRNADWQSDLCGQSAIVVVDMRENGHIWLCRRHWTAAAQRLARERGYRWRPIAQPDGCR